MMRRQVVNDSEVFSLLNIGWGNCVSSAPADTATRPEIGKTPDTAEINATTALFDLTVLAIQA